MTDNASAQYTEWFDFYGQRVTGWMCIDKLRIECARLQDAGSAPSPELLLVHAMHELERLHGEKVTTANALQRQAEEIAIHRKNIERLDSIIHEQAEEIEALRADGGRLDFLDQLSNRAAASDMHCSYGSVVLYVRTGIGSQLLAQGKGTARAAIDSAMQGVKG